MAVESLEGRKVGDRWMIVEPVARGGMSTVYQGRDEVAGEDVAIKILRADLKPELRSVERFQREARAASRLDHPNIISFMSHGELDGRHFYLVMEYIDGVSLQEAIFENAPFGVRRTLRIGAQIAEALSHAHQKKVLHRDLKPGNIVLVHRRKHPDFVKILDFGLAKIQGHDEADTLTRAGLVFGTPEYMSPEQACGQAVDGRCDIYACGAIMFEMLTGRPPFSGGGIFDTLRSHVIEPPPSPGDVRGDVVIPPLVERIVLRCLEKRPENRFASASQLARALRAMGKNLAGPRTKKDSSGVADSQIPTMGHDRAILFDADDAAQAEYQQLRRHRQETLRRAAALLEGQELALQLKVLLTTIGEHEHVDIDLGAELAVVDSAFEEARSHALEEISRLRLTNIDKQMEATRLKELIEAGNDDPAALEQLSRIGQELDLLERQLFEAEKTFSLQSEEFNEQRESMRSRITDNQSDIDRQFDTLASMVRHAAGPAPTGELAQLLEDLDSFERFIAAHDALKGGVP